MNTSSPIPQRFVDLCGEFAKLARDAGLSHMTVTMDPGFGLRANGEWRDRITMMWDAGRHEADVRNFTISSTVVVAATIEESKAPGT